MPVLLVIKGLSTIDPGTSTQGPSGAPACWRIKPVPVQLTVMVPLAFPTFKEALEEPARLVLDL